MKTPLRWAVALAMASSLAVPACSSTRACRQGSIFLTMTLESPASAVVALDVEVSLDDVLRMTFPIARPDKGFTSSESYEIDLSQYQSYKTVAITVIARNSAGDEIERGVVTSRQLTPNCLALSVPVTAPSGAGGAGGGGITTGGSGGGGSAGAGAGAGGLALGGSSGGGTTASGGASSAGGKGGGDASGGITSGSGGVSSGSGGVSSGSGGVTSVGGKGGGMATGGAGGTNACVSRGTGVVAILDCPCAAPGSLACNGNAQSVTLICSAGTWMHNQTCMAGNLCDSRMGVSAGTCQPIVPACKNATAGQLVCDPSTSVAQCGPDLVSDPVQQACTGATPACLNHACVACTPASTEACGVCNDGTATCDSAGAWGTCVGASSKNTYYRDADGDGFGDPKTAMTVCGAAPTGTVANSKDCCDLDANAHPGQTAFFGTADACGSNQVPNGYDYDCDGTNTTESSVANASCVTTVSSSASCGCPMCYCTSTNGAAPVCGLRGCDVFNEAACGAPHHGVSWQLFDSVTCAANGSGTDANAEKCR